MLELRPLVKSWAERMEKELRLNESKGGWEDEDYDYLLNRAKENLREIKTSKLYGMNPKTIDKNYAIKCCADCSNFCMMLADILGGLGKK